MDSSIFVLMLKWTCLGLVLFLFSCEKYKDPDPFTDPRINKKYCNDPSAVNYNWDFPGVPDNSVCIYPAQLFKGSYFYRDSTLDANGNVVKRDSFNITIAQLDTVKVSVSGFCSSVFSAKTNRFFRLTLDSILGPGQEYCGNNDTIMGKGSKAGISDTSFIRFDYQIDTDTGLIFHVGTATKI